MPNKYIILDHLSLLGWCHPRNFVAFCESRSCHKVKNIKVYIFGKEISQGILFK